MYHSLVVRKPHLGEAQAFEYWLNMDWLGRSPARQLVHVHQQWRVLKRTSPFDYCTNLHSIIGLSFVYSIPAVYRCLIVCRLACGFLLVILSCALFSNWLPLLVVATYILAPLPNAICARYAAGEDFMSDSAG